MGYPAKPSRAGLLDADDLHLTTTRSTSRMTWAEMVAEAVACALRVNAVLLVIDTLPAIARVRGDDENAAGRAFEVMEPLIIAADEHQIGIVTTFHDRKSGGEPGESGRGSSAYAGSVDVIIQITRPGGNVKPTTRKLATESRYSATPSELFIDLGADGYRSLGSEGDVARVAVTAALADTLPTTEERAVTINGVAKGGDRGRLGGDVGADCTRPFTVPSRSPSASAPRPASRARRYRSRRSPRT